VPIQTVVGKVVMRIPWLRYIALDLGNSTALLLMGGFGYYVHNNRICCFGSGTQENWQKEE